MRPPLSYVPALFPLLGFIAGMLLSSGLGWTGAAALTAVGAAAMAAGRRRSQPVAMAGLTLLFAAAGAADVEWQRPADASALPTGRNRWQGVVVEVAENDRGHHLTVGLDSIAGRRRLTALVHTRHSLASAVAPGDVVDFRCTLAAPANDAGPTAYDYAAMLARRGIAVAGFTDSIAVVGRRTSWRSQAWRWRTAAEGLLLRSNLSDGACSFLVAVLLGDDDWLSQATRDTFSAAGLAHVLALSGLHVAIIAALLGLLLMPLGLFCDWRRRCAVVVGALWAYAMLTGMSPSVTRAALMATMVSGGIILQRPYVSLNGLLAAALLILLVAPGQLWLPGFQMSFLAVASILLLMPALTPWLRHWPRWLRWIAIAAALSVAAMAGTAMVALYYFHIFPVYFLLANLPVALMLPVLMVGGLLLMAAEALGYDPAWLCTAIDAAYDAMYRWAVAIVGMPSATLRDVYVGGATLLPYYASLLLLAAALHRRSAALGVACAATLLATAVTARLCSPEPPMPQWFIPRSPDFTTLIYRPADGGPPAMLTTAPPTAREALRREYQWRYRRYLAAAATDSLAARTGPVARLRAGSATMRIVLVANDSLVRRPPADCIAADYAVICRGYRRSWREVVAKLRPRALLISADVAKRRHLATVDSIAAARADSAAAQPLQAISLRSATFTYP